MDKKISSIFIAFILFSLVLSPLANAGGEGLGVTSPKDESAFTIKDAGFFDKLFSIFTEFSTINNKKSTYNPGETFTINFKETYKLAWNQCPAWLDGKPTHAVVEIYNVPADSQSTATNIPGTSRQVFPVDAGPGKTVQKIIDYTIPSSAGSGTWSYSTYLWCQDFPNGPNAAFYSSVTEENFNIGTTSTITPPPTPPPTTSPNIEVVNAVIQTGKEIGSESEKRVRGIITLKNTGASMTSDNIIELQVQPRDTGLLAILQPSTEQKTCDANFPGNVHLSFRLQAGEQKSFTLVSPQTGDLSDGDYVSALYLRTKCFDANNPNENRFVPGAPQEAALIREDITIGTPSTPPPPPGECIEEGDTKSSAFFGKPCCPGLIFSNFKCVASGVGPGNITESKLSWTEDEYEEISNRQIVESICSSTSQCLDREDLEEVKIKCEKQDDDLIDIANKAYDADCEDANAIYCEKVRNTAGIEFRFADIEDSNAGVCLAKEQSFFDKVIFEAAGVQVTGLIFISLLGFVVLFIFGIGGRR